MMYIYFWLGLIALTIIGGVVLGLIAAKARQWEMRERKDKSLSNQLNNGHRINGGFRTRPSRPTRG